MKRLKGYWWIIGLRGIILVVTGAITMLSKESSGEIMVQNLAGLFAVIGIIQLASSLIFRKKINRWKSFLLISLLDLAIAGLIFYDPVKGTEWFNLIIASWTLLLSVLLFYLAVTSTGSKTILTINGVLCLVFSLFIFLKPEGELQASLITLSLMTALLGLLLVAAAIKIYTYKEKSPLEEAGEAAISGGDL